MSRFEEPRNYYVYKYVYDPVKEDYTELEGEIQGFTKATDPWEACKNLGFDDENAYFAKEIEDLDKYPKAIADERKHLTKISKQLKEMTDERDAERDKVLKERECPNGCGKMDEEFRCKDCGFGYEQEALVKDLDRVIKEEKKKGNDTSELEELRDAIKESLK